jgi:hypothetical protein
MMTFLHAIFFGLMVVSMAGSLAGARRRPVYALLYAGVVAAFFLLSFLRWEMGNDWVPYLTFFEQAEVGAGGSFEPGFELLNYWVRELTGSYTVMLMIQAAIIYTCIGVTTWRYSVDPVFSIFVVFALTFGEIYFVRQGVALAVCFYSFRFIVARRIWPFLLCVFLASQFHVTAWVFVPAYFLYRMVLTDRRVIVLVVVSIAVSLVLSEAVLRLLGSVGGFVGDKIALYLDLGDDPTLTAGGGDLTLRQGLIRGFLHRAFILVVSLWALGRTRGEDRRLNGIYNLYLFSIVLYLLTAPFSLVIARVANYYDYFLMLVIPAMVTGLKIRSNRVVVFVAVALYLFVRFQGAYNSRPEFFAPYRSVFNKERVI